jgi:hypothetical protein
LKPGIDIEMILGSIKDEDVVFTRNGHAVALLSDFDDDELFWRKREQEPEFIASIKSSREQIDRGEGIPLEKVKRELGIE